MTDEDKKAVAEAKGPSWKKVLIWIGVVLLILTGITVILVMAFRKKNPAAAAKEIIRQAKESNFKADVGAKIEIAKARAVEEATVKELERIREIEDEKERAERLADLL